MDREVILIWPSNIAHQSALYPPLGLAYLYSALKRDQIAARALDLSFDPEMSELKSLRTKNGIYGISFTTSMFAEVRKCISLIREQDPGSSVVLGGPHVTVFPDSGFTDLGADYVCVGEAEISFPRLIQSLHAGTDCTAIPGILLKKDGEIVRTVSGGFVEDLDMIAMPDQSIFPLEKYFGFKGFRELSMYTSRGCPARCTFCQPTLIDLFGKKTRFHSCARVVAEMELLAKKHRLDLIVMSDDSFAIERKRIHKICRELIRRNTPVFWRVQTRIRGLDQETIRLMKRAGCVLVALGVESGSQKVLNNINKGVNLREIRDCFRMCREEGLLTHAYLMVGNLGDSEESIRATEALLLEIRPFSSNVSLTTPYPGTYLFDKAIELGILKNQKWEQFNHILDGPMHLALDGLTMNDLMDFKRRLIQVQNHPGRRLLDLCGLVFDYYFIRRALKMVIVNPGCVFRMCKLVLRSLRKTGFALTNPATDATEAMRTLLPKQGT